jgi:hypothetical protein
VDEPVPGAERPAPGLEDPDERDWRCMQAVRSRPIMPAQGELPLVLGDAPAGLLPGPAAPADPTPPGPVEPVNCAKAACASARLDTATARTRSPLLRMDAP